MVAPFRMWFPLFETYYVVQNVIKGYEHTKGEYPYIACCVTELKTIFCGLIIDDF